MPKTYIPCDRCIAFLERRDQDLVELWKQLCLDVPDAYRYWRIMIDGMNAPVWVTLEQFGFITTHECNSVIGILRIEGIDEQRGCVCAGRHK